MLHRRTASLVAAVCVTVFALGACSGSNAPKDDTVDTNDTISVVSDSSTLQSGVTGTIIDTPPELIPSTLTPTTPPTALSNDYAPAKADVSTVVQAIVPSVTVFESATSGTTAMTLQNPLPSGAPLTFLVDGQTPTRYKVLLPVRPNGSTGWVEPAQVKKFEHDYKLVVELSAHRITAYNGKNVIISEKIATGKNDTPTPNGRYYIKELLKPCYDVKQADGTMKCTPNDNGDYGPYAYGLSGFSPVLTDFNGGTGVLGIHGTDQPELLGTDVSHGCIRMSNSGITVLAKVLPLGTPVIVRP